MSIRTAEKFEVFTENEKKERYKLLEFTTFLDARRYIQRREGNIRLLKRIVKAADYDKYLVNGRIYWIEWT